MLLHFLQCLLSCATMEASAEGTTYAPLVSSPETPPSEIPTTTDVDATVAEQSVPPHQQKVTVVIDSPDEPPREFAQSDDDDDDEEPSRKDDTQADSPQPEEEAAAATGEANETTYKSADDFEKTISDVPQPTGRSDDNAKKDAEEGAAEEGADKATEELATEDKENNNAAE